MPVETARKLLPSGSIIGKTCNTLEQVKQAVAEDVHYVGLGPVYPTDTKKDASPAIGVRKIGTMLEILGGTSTKAVVIGKYSPIFLCRYCRQSAGPQGVSSPRTLSGFSLALDP